MVVQTSKLLAKQNKRGKSDVVMCDDDYRTRWKCNQHAAQAAILRSASDSASRRNGLAVRTRRRTIGGLTSKKHPAACAVGSACTHESASTLGSARSGCAWANARTTHTSHGDPRALQLCRGLLPKQTSRRAAPRSRPIHLRPLLARGRPNASPQRQQKTPDNCNLRDSPIVLFYGPRRRTVNPC
jgi:hypothetical protein